MFSKSTEYALRATIFIARQTKNYEKVSIQQIAEGIGAPKHYTAKILQQLSNKVISSISGPTGGFFITDEERKLPVYTVIQLMNETNIIEDCVLGLPHCSEKNPCSLYKSYEVIKQDLLKMFKEKSIDELAQSKDRIFPINPHTKKRK